MTDTPSLLQAPQLGYPDHQRGGFPSEASGLPGQRLSTASLASSTHTYQSSSTSRLSQGVPPPAAFASPPGSTYSPSPRSSYAGLPLQSGLPPASARPPPPYRAPPPDPVQARPLPSRPAEPVLCSPPPAPPKRSASGGGPPLLPPVAISSSPPPLPRRHPSDVGSAPPRDRSNSQDPSSSTRISDCQQPSPTDSGFTEDSKSFSEPLQGRSKSYGNLTVERENEVLTQAVSLDQVSQVFHGMILFQLEDQFST